MHLKRISINHTIKEIEVEIICMKQRLDTDQKLIFIIIRGFKEPLEKLIASFIYLVFLWSFNIFSYNSMFAKVFIKVKSIISLVELYVLDRA